MIYAYGSQSWPSIIDMVGDSLSDQGTIEHVGEWQSLKGGEKDPRMTMLELNNVVLQGPIQWSAEGLAKAVTPNLPWAEVHFQERVGGEPLNPGRAYTLWPWYSGNVEQHKDPGQFSHTYMERFWPKLANGGYKNSRGEATGLRNMGIRYLYGDLADVVSQLSRSPGTRQAYLPVWFPEDTGAVPKERVPCTLGYHFLVRGGCLDCTYFIRSCDYFRHLRDDIYLAGRLVQWMVEEINELNGDTIGSPAPGKLTMHIVNLHCFAAEKERLNGG
jgi:Thymidylate synthase